jgi:hypothetical protein
VVGFVNGWQSSLYQVLFVLQSVAALVWDKPEEFYILAALRWVHSVVMWCGW